MDDSDSISTTTTTTINDSTSTELNQSNYLNYTTDFDLFNKCQDSPLSENSTQSSTNESIIYKSDKLPKSCARRRTKGKSIRGKNNKSALTSPDMTERSVDVTQRSHQIETEERSKEYIKTGGVNETYSELQTSQTPSHSDSSRKNESISEEAVSILFNSMLENEATDSKTLKCESLEAKKTNIDNITPEIIPMAHLTEIPPLNLPNTVSTLLHDQINCTVTNFCDFSNDLLSDLLTEENCRNGLDKVISERKTEPNEVVVKSPELKTSQVIVPLSPTHNLFQKDRQTESLLLPCNFSENQTDLREALGTIQAETASIFQIEEDYSVPTPSEGDSVLTTAGEKVESLESTATYVQNLEVSELLPLTVMNSGYGIHQKIDRTCKENLEEFCDFHEDISGEKLKLPFTAQIVESNSPNQKNITLKQFNVSKLDEEINYKTSPTNRCISSDFAVNTFDAAHKNANAGAIKPENLNEINATTNKDKFQVQKILDEMYTSEITSVDGVVETSSVKKVLKLDLPILNTASILKNTNNNFSDEKIYEKVVSEEIPDISTSLDSILQEPINNANMEAKNLENKNGTITLSQDEKEILNNLELTNVKKVETSEYVRDDSDIENDHQNHHSSSQNFQINHCESSNTSDNGHSSEKDAKYLLGIKTTIESDIDPSTYICQKQVDINEVKNIEKVENSTKLIADQDLPRVDFTEPQFSSLNEICTNSVIEHSNNTPDLFCPTILGKNKIINPKLVDIKQKYKNSISSSDLDQNLSSLSVKSDFKGAIKGKISGDDDAHITSRTRKDVGSSASEVRRGSKRGKFEPQIGEQALAQELVTISRVNLDRLYEKIEKMQKEIDRLSVTKSQKVMTQVIEDTSKCNSKPKDALIQMNKLITSPSIETTTTLQHSKNIITKSFDKRFISWKILSSFGNTFMQSDAGLVARSSNSLVYPNPQTYKGKGKETVAPEAAKTYKVISRVRAKNEKP